MGGHLSRSTPLKRTKRLTGESAKLKRVSHRARGAGGGAPMTAPAYASVGPNTRDDWETPVQLFDALDRIFRFDVDAAADDSNHKVDRWLTGPCRGDEWCGCGLCARWAAYGHSIWLNPPYGTGLDRWVSNCAASALDGATVVALLPNGTDTDWFKQVWLTASEIWFLSGRVQFVGSTSSNPKGSIVAVWRPEPTADLRDAPKVRLWDWRSEKVPA